ncbi:hypothetical protein SAMN06265360_12129 [Haloechinothrix alba]|uniref:Uncharacterized protein n=1 Tax=Haloechinothrix alba TaxID=664784 RepID=A0A238ZHB2_9PSEU|nr:hypothetical protein [Haloechinothrix alba]SNR82054.1 hypothetical protein SAMN06265360_12129 [Haloechinothrix alba]
MSGGDALPWAGLVRPTTRIPDVPTLAGRYAAEAERETSPRNLRGYLRRNETRGAMR